jgi:PIN domain nuclease of toxin-antitoxin system
LIDGAGHVIDASALLAMLHAEPGAEAVEPLVDGASMSTVNWSEVVQKSMARGVDVSGLRGEVEALGLSVVPFSVEDSEIAAELWGGVHQRAGLSLADRACLALARRLGATAVTADRTWRVLRIGVQVTSIR